MFTPTKSAKFLSTSATAIVGLIGLIFFVNHVTQTNTSGGASNSEVISETRRTLEEVQNLQSDLPPDIADADQRSPELAKHIRDQWIHPPSTEPRHLDNPNQTHYSQRGQSEYIDRILKGRSNGFYVECGAAFGEGLSNSLFFEKDRGWSGLLIEANPSMFRTLLSKHRHAYTLNACLSPERRPVVLEFREASVIGGLLGFMDDKHKERILREEGEANATRIQCFPLFSVLRALGVTHVDYFSLDIEGAELEVLQTIPFDDLQIDVLTVEYVITDNPKMTKQKLQQMKDLLVGRFGYKVANYEGSEDVMFIKNV